MANCTKVVELLDRMTGRSTQAGGDEYVHVYRVEFDDRPLSVYYVMRAKYGNIFIPRLGMQHSENPYARVISVEPQQIEGDDRRFDVRVTFSTKGPDEGGPEEIPNPLDRPAEWSFEFQGVEIEMEKDARGYVVLNSAGAPFQQQPTDTVFSVVMNVAKYVEKFPLDTVTEYLGAINNDQYTVCDFTIQPYQSRLMGASARQHSEGGISCEYAAWRLELRDVKPGFPPEERWDAHPIDMGYGGLVPDESTPNIWDMKYVVFKDDEGQQFQEPTLLDGNGRKLDRPFTDEPIYLHFQRGVHKAFGLLGLPP